MISRVDHDSSVLQINYRTDNVLYKFTKELSGYVNLSITVDLGDGTKVSASKSLASVDVSKSRLSIHDMFNVQFAYMHQEGGVDWAFLCDEFFFIMRNMTK